MLTRKYPFVHRQYDKVLEVDATGFEDAHNLQAFERLAFKGDFCGIDGAFNQEKECFALQVNVVLVQSVFEFRQFSAITFNESKFYCLVVSFANTFRRQVDNVVDICYDVLSVVKVGYVAESFGNAFVDIAEFVFGYGKQVSFPHIDEEPVDFFTGKRFNIGVN